TAVPGARLRSAASLPRVQLKLYTAPIVLGSIPETPMFEAPKRARSARTLEATETSVVRATARPTATGRGFHPFWETTTASAFSCRSTATVCEARSPFENAERQVTRASPTISAAAVDAVRAGLRIAFCRASRPAAPPAA